MRHPELAVMVDLVAMAHSLARNDQVSLAALTRRSATTIPATGYTLRQLQSGCCGIAQ